MSTPQDSLETEDAKKVDAALEQLFSGNHIAAERILKEVIANAPHEYTLVEESPAELRIKFWDQHAFLHYVNLGQKEKTIDRGIVWIGNAYPRAFYYLGFIDSKLKRHEQALAHLAKAGRLQPQYPAILCETGHVLAGMGRLEEALAMYESVSEVGPFVSAHQYAAAKRGCGFVLIEMGRLDEAEAKFMLSLVYQPDNEIARNELAYIEHLREGGRSTKIESVQTFSPDTSVCALCRQKFDKGVSLTYQGAPIVICRRCERKLTKRWWEFWK